MIEFIEDQNEGYAPRTIINASADVTLAFAKDFTTAGEKLTKRAVKDQNKLYIPISKIYYSGESAIGDIAFEVVCKNKDLFPSQEISLNIAGNGIYTMKGALQQYQVDDYVYKFLYTFKNTLKSFGIEISLIRSGGQTGFDEAGLKAGEKLGLKTLCLAPKEWKFRNMFGQDICDEIQFKNRFN